MNSGEGQEKEFVIPTRYRDKISSKLSWPLGAKELTEALIEVPQIKNLQLVFGVPFKMPQQGNWPISFSVLEVEYVNPPAHPLLSYHSDWEICVHPVPRQIRAKVRESLHILGLKTVVEWLAKYSVLSGRPGSLRFDVVWNCELEQLTFDSHGLVLPSVRRGQN